MSLVNKMLRDLDARRVGDGDRAALPSAVTPLAARQDEPRPRGLLVLGTVLVTSVLGAAAWYLMQPRPVAPVAPPAILVSPAPVTTVAQAETPPQAAVANAPADTAPSSRSDAKPETDLRADPGLSSLRMDDVLATTPVVVASQTARSIAEKPKPVIPRKTPATPVAAQDDAPSAVPMKPKESVKVEVASVAKAPTTASIAAPRPLPASVPKPSSSVEPRIEKQVRLPLPEELADSEYRRGLQAQRQGNAFAAIEIYRAALEAFPAHAQARLALSAILIETKRYDEAEELLGQGTHLSPVKLASALMWARLKVERNQAPAALDILEKNAASGEASAEYQGFAGALLNREGRSSEAVQKYRAATRLAPNEARWWAGLGIALDAAGRGQEARDAYQKARGLPGLPADLAKHIEQRMH